MIPFLRHADSAFILQRLPQALDEDVVDAAPFSVHGDPGANALQAVSPGKGCELAALIGVHDPGRAKVVDGLVQCLDAEVSLQCAISATPAPRG